MSNITDICLILWVANNSYWYHKKDYFNPYNAEICLYKPWRPKGFLNMKLS